MVNTLVNNNRGLECCRIKWPGWPFIGETGTGATKRVCPQEADWAFGDAVIIETRHHHKGNNK